MRARTEMNKISAVYQIINTVTGEMYVGSSKNVFRRWHEHKRLSVWKAHPNSQMYKDMQKYGVDKFSFQILAPVEPEYLKQVEQELIEMLCPAYNDRRSKGLDVERWKETVRKAKRKYYSQICSYNGEKLTLDALVTRFRRAGIEHPKVEAKRYLLSQQQLNKHYKGEKQ